VEPASGLGSDHPSGSFVNIGRACASKNKYVNPTKVSWNARSVKKNLLKLREVLMLNCDIVPIQESWLCDGQDIAQLFSYLGTSYQCKRMDRRSGVKKTGGGTLILFREGLTVIKEIRISEDSELYQLIFNSLSGTRTIWLGNVYLNRGSKAQIQSLFRNVEKIVPPDYCAEYFPCGRL